MKTLNLHSDYSKYGGYIQLCLPIETERFIPVRDSVRLLNKVFEEMDYTNLYRSYSEVGRNPAVSPKTLCKIMIYAYSLGIYSSRKIERACHMDLGFIYLLQGEQAPDHNTINRFRKDKLVYFAEELLTQFVELLHDLDEVQFRTLFVDGTKFEANANRYTFVWRKSTEKYRAKLQDKCRTFLLNHLAEEDIPHHLSAEFLEELALIWRRQAELEDTVFVHGIGKRKGAWQKAIETIEGYAVRERKYATYLDILGSTRNSFSKTDPDATFMRLKDDHMRNSQLKAAYNVQLGTESEYVVGIDVSSERTDVQTFIPFLERIKRNYARTFLEAVADAGYESEENYRYLEKEHITAYIKPSNYEYSKTRKFQREQVFRLAMSYDKEGDFYTCKAGRPLLFTGYRTHKRKGGFSSQSKIYTCETCTGCTHLGTCYKGKYSKQIQVNENFDKYRKRSLANVTSQYGTVLRVNRSIQAEGVFGVLKENMQFTRFLTRGETNVRTEMLLLALGFNINKLHNRIQNGRLGQHLFPLQKAG